MLTISSIGVTSPSYSLLNHISFSLPKGGIYGLMGPNGAGKTTLLKVIAGLVKPTTGDVLWEGSSLLKLSRRELSQVSTLVPQNPQPAFDFSTEQIIEMGLYASKGNVKEKHQLSIDEALEAVDLSSLRKRSIHTLSAGERQRAYIARALVSDASLILLDEPTANLDLRHQLEIWQLLKRLAQCDRTLLIATHDIGYVKRFCDAVAVLNKSTFVDQGPPTALLTPELLNEIFSIDISFQEMNEKSRPENSFIKT